MNNDYIWHMLPDEKWDESTHPHIKKEEFEKLGFKVNEDENFISFNTDIDNQKDNLSFFYFKKSKILKVFSERNKNDNYCSLINSLIIYDIEEFIWLIKRLRFREQNIDFSNIIQ